MGDFCLDRNRLAWEGGKEGDCIRGTYLGIALRRALAEQSMIGRVQCEGSVMGEGGGGLGEAVCL